MVDSESPRKGLLGWMGHGGVRDGSSDLDGKGDLPGGLGHFQDFTQDQVSDTFSGFHRRTNHKCWI